MVVGVIVGSTCIVVCVCVGIKRAKTRPSWGSQMVH